MGVLRLQRIRVFKVEVELFFDIWRNFDFWVVFQPDSHELFVVVLDSLLELGLIVLLVEDQFVFSGLRFGHSLDLQLPPVLSVVLSDVDVLDAQRSDQLQVSQQSAETDVVGVDFFDV